MNEAEPTIKAASEPSGNGSRRHLKILFVMLHPGYIRNYESAIRMLAEHGHKIHLAFNISKKQSDDKLAERLEQDYPEHVSSGELPERTDGWRIFSQAVRKIIDYLRYLHPKYDGAAKLKNRVELRIPPIARIILQRIRTVAGFGVIKGFIQFLRFVENAVPCDKKLLEYVRTKSADVMLVTPLVNFASGQVDFIKCAKSLGVKNALCVASWDNLTNKGLMRVDPDLVFVWNEIQKREAIELHGAASSRVVVTGAQCYDKWFAQRPSTTQSEFCHKVGLDERTPFILYLCSSPFISSREVAFVENWINRLRSSADPHLASAGILVRPHPQNAEQWKKADFSHMANVAIYPRNGSNPVADKSKADYYDSMYHSSGVVGINTSAMIEAGVLGKPVFTIVRSDFRETQEGTLHFHYLVDGGLLHTTSDYREHISQLKGIFNGKSDYGERARRFVGHFVRPHGMDVPATPILVDSIERLANRTVAVRYRPTIIHLLARFALLPLALCVEGYWRMEEAKKRGMLAKKLFFRSTLFLLRLFRLNAFVKKHILPLVVEEIGRMPEAAEADPVKKIRGQIRKIARGKDPVVVGPWLSEIGFEVLYWIPFLQWIISKHGLQRERVIVVSRGGAAPWYDRIGVNYLDIFDYFSEREFKEKNLQRITDTGGQKHGDICEFDRDIIWHVRKATGLKEFDWLHPSLMYKLFSYYWRRRAPTGLVGMHTEYRRFNPLSREGLPSNIPEDYIAAKFYFSACFPDTPANRRFISDTLSMLTKKNHVVLLNTGLDIDDHSENDGVGWSKVHTLGRAITPRNNLTLQTQVIANAKAFIGTYGGFSYLAPFYGIPSMAFYSNEEKFLPVHLDIAYRAIRALKFGQFDKMGKDDQKTYEPSCGADFVAMSTRNLDILKMFSHVGEFHDIVAR